MTATSIRFGTDGWRGRIAEDYTFDAVRRCSHGYAQHILDSEGEIAPVVIGFDKRYGSARFAAAAAEVVAGNGLKVLLTERATPTPVISHAAVENGAAGAINITASHNPSTDNGFKVRDSHGGAMEPERLRLIEAAIPDSGDDAPRIRLDEALASEQVIRFDPDPGYIRKVNELVDLEPIREAGLTVCFDAMWGNGAGWFNRVLDGGSTEVIEIHGGHNPLFPEMIRPEPIPPNIDVGLAASVEHSADALIVNDGDADRVGLGDENGKFVDQLRVYALLAYYFLEVRGERGPIVKTLSTTSLLNRLGELYEVPVYETGVGFKYVAPKMLEVDALIGGEESGGFAFHNHVPERDGILAGLYLLDLMVQTGKRPSELVELLFEVAGPSYYKRVDTQIESDQRESTRTLVERAEPESIGGLRVTGINRTDGHKFELEDGGWLLVRFSGTEPVIRVYTETTDPSRVDAIIQDGLRIADLV